MQRLMLFDVDGTLVKTPPTTAFIESIKNLHGVTIKDDRQGFAGLTDQLILSLLLKGAGWEDTRIKSHMPGLVQEFERIYVASFKKGSVDILPGVKELLAALSQHEVTLGLITGNLEKVAQTKLEDVGIWSFFSLGGFGSDPHTKRSEIVKIAVARAGLTPDNPSLYVIGDTPRDIEAAAEAGIAHKVGVSSNYHNMEQLKEAGADIVLKDFKDTTGVLKALGITDTT